MYVGRQLIPVVYVDRYACLAYGHAGCWYEFAFTFYGPVVKTCPSVVAASPAAPSAPGVFFVAIVVAYSDCQFSAFVDGHFYVVVVVSGFKP